MRSTCELRVYTVFPKGQHLRHSFPETCSPRWNSDHFQKTGVPYQTVNSKHILAANSINYDSTKDLASSHLMHSSLPFQEMNQLLGLSHSQTDWTYRYRREGSELTEWECNNSPVYRGLLPQNAVNIVDESFWSARLYDSHSFYERSHPSKAIHIEYISHWWKRLELLVQRHYHGVGRWTSTDEGGIPRDIQLGEFYRNVAVVSQYFLEFEKSVEEFTCDTSLVHQIKNSCPKKLSDLFALFIEMEANKVHYDYCPRCSQPYETTRFCGQGIRFTPYHKYQGIWNPHQLWSKEWNEVVANRAEALFTKSTEHPIFGSTYHTQRQAEALMRVYEVTYQRGRANTFLTKLRGSMEYQLGVVTVSQAMMKSYEDLMDKTSHPILLTHNANDTRRDVTSNPYSGLSLMTPQQSVKKLRLDMEMDRFRREQREEGVVRIPPVGWDLNMNELKEYSYLDKKTPNSQRITNWREVKEGIEKSFLNSRRLPDFAYIEKSKRDSKKNLRLVHFYENKVKQIPTEEYWKEVEIDNAREKKELREPFSFPDEHAWRWYERGDIHINAAIHQRCLAKDVHNIRHGNVIRFERYTFEDPTDVPFLASRKMNITSTMCAQFGFQYGSKFSSAKSSSSLLIVGVDTKSFHLVGVTDTKEILEIGQTLNEVTAYIKAHNWTPLKENAALHPAIEKHRLCREEFTARVVGVRDAQLWIQTLPEEGVASPLGEFVVDKSLSVVDTRRVSPPEPFSWKIPFRNNWAEQELQDALEAPWKSQPLAPLISDRMTPKRKIFGYTQHNENNDFVTKEYHDRLRSKQFYANPKSFQVVPEVYENAPNFGGKWESAYTSGLPTVDRRELTRGWNTVVEPSDLEVRAIEQGIRDISATRPGNYYKRTSELASFTIGEDWWNVFPYWEHMNFVEGKKRQVEQRFINHNSLPFGGRIPALGAAGIGERFKYITDHLEKGFGVGPTGFSPTSQQSTTNTLEYESKTEEHMNTSNVVLTLFQQKLAKENLSEAQVIWSTGIRMKETMIALEDWSRHKKTPSSGLLRMLGHFLRNEIDAYNKDLPDGLSPLTMPKTDVLPSTTTQADVWVERDLQLVLLASESAKGNCVDGETNLIAQEGFIQYKYVHSKLFGKLSAQDGNANLKVDDSALEKWCRQVHIDDFTMTLAKYINVGIPKQFLKAVRNSKEVLCKELRKSNKWIATEGLKYLLMECQIPLHDAAYILRHAPDVHYVIESGQVQKKFRHSLSDCLPSKVDATQNKQTYYHVPTLLKWNGNPTDHGASIRREEGPQDSSKGSRGIIKQRSLLDVLSKGKSQDDTATKAALQLGDVLSNFAMYFGDAAAMDFAYRTRENVQNQDLFREFVRFSHPLVMSTKEFVSIGGLTGMKHTKGAMGSMKALYKDYTEGAWVPSGDEIRFLLVTLLRNIADSIDGTLVDGKSEFEHLVVTSEDGRMRAAKPPSHALPFDFDSIQFEKVKSRECFALLGLSDDTDAKALSNLYVCNRTRRIDYKGYGTVSYRGQLSYGEHASAEEGAGKKVADLLAIDGNFTNGIVTEIERSHQGKLTTIIHKKAGNFSELLKKLIVRHMPLLSHYYMMWKRAGILQGTTQERLSQEAEEFRQIFEINKEPKGRGKEDFSKADGPFQDDLNLFNQNPEKYWKEVLRVRRRMGVPKGRNSSYSTDGPVAAPRKYIPRSDSPLNVSRTGKSAEPPAFSQRGSSYGVGQERIRNERQAVQPTPSSGSLPKVKEESNREKLKKIATFPSLRGVPNTPSAGSSLGRGRRPVL
ncbi:hypothetical protein XU18_3691 [Perkinsela sp. CCAP 1560/4]|nr:hypothetical protein XU18_3691 [Perkinsela sp. CCAP 1560/4]|eukprot:KNH05287.1 hypothetical protein XU18_3691 [Perkinsela sp. CCAP 1560/4]